MSFAPCPSCGRHIKTSEATCPFCAQGTRGALTATPALSTRATRAAIYAFTTTLAVAGCTSGSPTSSSSSSASSGSASSSGESSSGVAPAYGAPAPDEAGATSSSSSASAYGGPPSSSTSSGDPVPAYGAPAVDAGK